jgi:P4 family phage/plasmid primase-like protien
MSIALPPFNSTPLGSFLHPRRVKKGDDNYADWNVTGMAAYDVGSYVISDEDYDKFLTLFTNHVFTRNYPCSLLERHYAAVGPLLVDLDFRYESGGHLRRRFTTDHVRRFIAQYVAAMIYFSRVEALPADLDFYVTSKPLPENEGGKHKDGIHIECPTLSTVFKYQYAIRGFLLQKEAIRTTFGSTGLINGDEKVYDVAVIQKNNWFLYGSSKQNKAQYGLTAVYRVPIAAVAEFLDGGDPAEYEDLVDIVEEAMERVTAAEDNATLVRKLSIRREKVAATPAIREIRAGEWEELMIAWGAGKDRAAAPPARNTLAWGHEDAEDDAPLGGAGATGGAGAGVDTSDALTVISDDGGVNAPTTPGDVVLAHRLCRECLNAERRAGDYHDWVNLAICLKNISNTEESFRVWVDVTRRVDPSHKKARKTEAELRAKWGLIRIDDGKKQKLGMGSLQHWAEEDNPEKHRSILSESLTEWIILKAKETHVNIATFVCRIYKHEFRCCLGQKKGTFEWYQFGLGAHSWKHLRTPTELRSRLSGRVKDEYAEAWRLMGKREPTEESEKRRKVLRTIETKLENSGYKDSVLKECQEKFYDDDLIGKLNADAYLVGVANGVLDLNYFEKESDTRAHVHFRDGRPDDFVSFQMGRSDPDYPAIPYIPYDPSTPEQREIAEFFEKIYPDAVLREYVLTLLASCLLGANREQKFYVMQGSGGNGKSMIELLMELAFGDYGTMLSTTVVTRKRPDSGAANPDIITVQKRRFIHMGEPDDDEKINTSIMKQFSGGDRVAARGLFAEQEKFSIMGKIFMSCNELPPVSKMDGGTWRRLRVIPHVSMFKDPGDPLIDPAKNIYEKDLSLEGKLVRWRVSFLSLLVHYYETRYLAGGLKEPDCVVAASNKYKEENDLFMLFFNDNFVKDPSESSTLEAREVRNIFRDWKKSGGRAYEMKEMVVLERMKDMCRSNGKTFWGLKVAEQVRTDLSGATARGGAGAAFEF